MILRATFHRDVRLSGRSTGHVRHLVHAAVRPVHAVRRLARASRRLARSPVIIRRRSVHDRHPFSIIRRRGDDVKQARPSLTLAHVGLSDEVLLRVRRHLRRRPRRHEMSRDPAPISFPELLQPNQKVFMFLLRPRHA